MFENYIHTKKDLEAVEEALEYLERPELDFIFKDRNLINNTLVISFDSKELFIWTKLKTKRLAGMPCRVKDYNVYHIPHRIRFKDEEQRGWRARVKKKGILNLLPSEFSKDGAEKPKISGSLLTPFTKIHEKQRKSGFRPLDPYHTRESYLATIIHEFGHVYYNQHKLWYYSDKEENLSYMRLSADLYRGKKVGDLNKVPLRVPASFEGMSEIFAFCTDYYTASIFWPTHKEDTDRESYLIVKGLGEKERRLNLEKEDSILIKEPKNPKKYDYHNLAKVIGRLVFEKYPGDWPTKLLKVGEI